MSMNTNIAYASIFASINDAGDASGSARQRLTCACRRALTWAGDASASAVESGTYDAPIYLSEMVQSVESIYGIKGGSTPLFTYPVIAYRPCVCISCLVTWR